MQSLKGNIVFWTKRVGQEKLQIWYFGLSSNCKRFNSFFKIHTRLYVGEG